MQRRQSCLKSGGCGSGSRNFDFLGKFTKNFDFFRQLFSQRIDFLGQISEKFLFLSGNFTKNFDFSRQISEKYRFFRQFHKKFRFSKQKLGIYSYFWANYSISPQKSPLSNILPVHDEI